MSDLSCHSFHLASNPSKPYSEWNARIYNAVILVSWQIPNLGNDLCEFGLHCARIKHAKFHNLSPSRVNLIVIDVSIT